MQNTSFLFVCFTNSVINLGKEIHQSTSEHRPLLKQFLSQLKMAVAVDGKMMCFFPPNYKNNAITYVKIVINNSKMMPHVFNYLDTCLMWISE